MSDSGQHKEAVPEDVYDSDYFLRACGGADWVERFIASKGRDSYPHYRDMVEKLNIKPGECVLDMGCGRGEVTVMFGMAGAEVVGLDYSHAALEIAKSVYQACSKEVRGGLVFVQSDATTLPFASDSFDHVVMADIVEHLHDWQLMDMYAESLRILRPGGQLLVHTWPNRWHTDITYPFIARISRLFGSSRPLNPRKPHDEIVHVNEQSPLSLRRGVHSQGFEVVSDWCDHDAPFSWRPKQLIYWLLHKTPLLRLGFADHLWLLARKASK
ncbi:MAG: class I SAM-dependent methyltransferase [Mariprofundaceae bacterium]